MALYKLPVTLSPPSEETDNKYLAEVPVLPGCRAWGDSPEEALRYVQSVAAVFIESYRELGETLPDAVRPVAQVGEPATIQSELLVSA